MTVILLFLKLLNIQILRQVVVGASLARSFPFRGCSFVTCFHIFHILVDGTRNFTFRGFHSVDEFHQDIGTWIGVVFGLLYSEYIVIWMAAERRRVRAVHVVVDGIVQRRQETPRALPFCRCVFVPMSLESSLIEPPWSVVLSVKS